MSSIDLAHLRQWVGRERAVSQVLPPFPAQALAGVLDCDEPFEDGAELPLPWHWLYFLDAPRRAEVGEDGHPARGGFLPPVPLPRRMWAESFIDAPVRLVLGEAALKTSTVRSVDAKEGRSGPLVFVSVEHRIEQRSTLCLTETQTIVYREAPAAHVRLPEGEPATVDADWRVDLVPDEAMLFRYSALTYNGHRIHYDAEYARRTEFYPALVVHGPLLATLLIDALRRTHPGARVTAFSYRALRPAFVGQALACCGRLRGERAELWTVGSDGAVGVRAEARLA